MRLYRRDWLTYAIKHHITALGDRACAAARAFSAHSGLEAVVVDERTGRETIFRDGMRI